MVDWVDQLGLPPRKRGWWELLGIERIKAIETVVVTGSGGS